MIRLTGIRAFEARWQSLRSACPMDSYESSLLMQSMGRLVDNYASQSEIAAELSLPMQRLFNLLVQSYLEGYWVEGSMPKSISVAFPETGTAAATRRGATQTLSPAMVAAAQRQQRRRAVQPTEASEADTYIVHKSSRTSVSMV